MLHGNVNLFQLSRGVSGRSVLGDAVEVDNSEQAYAGETIVKGLSLARSHAIPLLVVAD